LLVQKFNWSKNSALTVKASIGEVEVVAIVDTGSSGVVVSESCVSCLNLVPNDEVEFSVTSATNSTKKLRKLFYNLSITVSNVSVKLPAIVLEGSHFDLLLGVSWIKATKAIINGENNTLCMGNTTVSCGYWPEPSSMPLSVSTMKSNTSVNIPAGGSCSVPINHEKLKANEVYYVTYKHGHILKGSLLVSSNDQAMVPEILISNQSDKYFSLQKGQNLGFFTITDNASYNKNDFTSYVLFKSLDIKNLLLHLDSFWLPIWHLLLCKWSNVLSKNKYDVGLTKEVYKIRFKDEVPIKGYVPRRTPAMVQAINKELDKLEKADFIEPSISPFPSPIVCVKKPDNTL